MGLPTSVAFMVVTMNSAISDQHQPINRIADVMHLNRNKFDLISEFWRTYTLVANPNIPCHTDPSRTPIAMREKIEAELSLDIGPQNEPLTIFQTPLFSTTVIWFDCQPEDRYNILEVHWNLWYT